MVKVDRGWQRLTKVYKDLQRFTKLNFFSSLLFALILCPSFSNITLVVGNINADHLINTILFQSENFLKMIIRIPCLHVEEGPVEMVRVDRLLQFSLATVGTAEATTATAPACYVFVFANSLLFICICYSSWVPVRDLWPIVYTISIPHLLQQFQLQLVTPIITRRKTRPKKTRPETM